MSDLFRLRLAYGITALLLVWPVIHIGLTKLCRLSSWKLAGWGMYATINPSQHGFSVWLLGPEDPPLDHLDIGPVLTRPQVARVSGNKLEVLDLDSAPREERIEMERMINDLKILPRNSGLESLAALVERMAMAEPGAAGKERALILVFSPRLDLSGAYTYMETTAYLVEGGQARKLKGSFSTRHLTERQVLQGIQQQMGRT